MTGEGPLGSALPDHASRLVEGIVAAQLPSGLYQVAIDGAGRDRTLVTAHVGGGGERNFVRLLVGDRVLLELMPRDRTRGRIVRKR